MTNLIKKIKSEPIVAVQVVAIIISTIAVVLGVYLLLSNAVLSFKIRLTIITVVSLLLIISIGLHLLFKKKNMIKSIIATIIFSIIITAAVGYLDYIFIRAITTLNNISVTTDDYITSYIYVPVDSKIKSVDDLVGKTIGLQSAASVTTNQMIIEGLEDLKISQNSYSQEIFANYNTAADALLIDNSIDAIALDEAAISNISDNNPTFMSQVRLITTFKKQQDTSMQANTVNTANEPFVVLISGVDTRSGDLNQASNSDVIMLATFNPQTMKLSLISIPRDSYLPVTCRGGYDKITHSGSGGISCTIASLEEAFDIKINYYLKVNFYGAVDVVNAMGGVELNVPFTFCEQNSQSEENAICLNEGYQTLDGEQALALSRHRYTLPRGDIDRGLNQQLVIQAMIQKLASGKIVTSVDKLLTVLGNNVQTNMNKDDMYGLFSLLSTITTNSLYGDATALQITSSTISGFDKMMYTAWAGADIYYYVPYDGSIKAVTSEINRILGNESYPLPTDEFAFNANIPFDNYTPADSIGNPSDTTSSAPLLNDQEEEETTQTSITISSNTSTYSHVLGDSKPSQSTIINTLGITAANQDGNSIDVSLSLDNVNWNVEGSYSFTATASYDGVTESKTYTVLVYSLAPEVKPDSVTISSQINYIEVDIASGPLSNSQLINKYGVTAKNQNGEGVSNIIFSYIDWSTIGDSTITATATYNGVTDSISLTISLYDSSSQTTSGQSE